MAHERHVFVNKWCHKWYIFMEDGATKDKFLWPPSYLPYTCLYESALLPRLVDQCVTNPGLPTNMSIIKLLDEIISCNSVANLLNLLLLES